ncbi:MAG TPA: hypothetical protein DIS90_14980 [Cytophagales bacterium]|nr:hypothetical protein [Cytophagales bacterium]
MKTNNYLALLFILSISTIGYAQRDNATGAAQPNTFRQLTVEPGIGIHTNFGTDLLITNLVQWNSHKRWSFGAHSSYSINNIMLQDFNYVHTDYNYSLNQKFGAGMMFNRKKGSHTFMLMAGIKYTAYKETLNHPDLDKASISISAFSPDYGILYSAKRGWKKYFFTYRMYLPLYPWPIKGSNILYTEGNMNNLALEFGIGMKVK